MSEENQQQNEDEKLTPEQKEDLEKWTNFKKNLEDKPDESITKGDLLFVLDVIFSDMQGVANLSGQALSNTQTLRQMIDPLLRSFENGSMNGRTKGGIITP